MTLEQMIYHPEEDELVVTPKSLRCKTALDANERKKIAARKAG